MNDSHKLHLTCSARAYVSDFLDRLNLKPISLNDEDMQELFKLLSRSEELETETSHNGHNWELSFAKLARQDERFIPVIERQVCHWIREGKIQGVESELMEWPEGKRFCVCLTHDMDIMREYLVVDRLRSLPFILNAPPRHRNMLLASTVKEILRSLTKRNKLSTPPVEAWLEAEHAFGFKSTMLFMADPIPEPSWEDPFYRYNDMIDFEGSRLTIGDLIGVLSERGWDIGLHGSSRSYNRADLLAAEKAALEQAAGTIVTSTRQHHLFWDVRVTPRVQSEAGLKTDSTVGSNINTEFRCGTGLPFLFFDLNADRPSTLLEIPLVIQDLALARNCAGDEELMVRTGTELMDRAARVGGVITLLWHNHFRRETAEFRCYRRLLQEAAAREAWGCSMRDLDTWWRSR